MYPTQDRHSTCLEYYNTAKNTGMHLLVTDTLENVGAWIRKPVTIWCAICPVQLKPGFIREEHTSPACQWPLKVSICPLKSGRDSGEDDEHADELSSDLF
jgi:hypothetical protein